MVVSCCVIGCVNRFNKSNPRSFYRIPKNPEMRRRLWIDAISRQDTSGKHWEPADHDRVCHLHFVTGMFMLWYKDDNLRYVTNVSCNGGQ